MNSHQLISWLLDMTNRDITATILKTTICLDLINNNPPFSVWYLTAIYKPWKTDDKIIHRRTVQFAEECLHGTGINVRYNRHLFWIDIPDGLYIESGW